MRTKSGIIHLLIIGTILLSGCSGKGGISVQDTWVRPALVGDNTAVYMIIRNTTQNDDALISVETNITSMAELHQSQAMDDADTMTMSPVDSIPVPAGSSVELKPGGYHIMLMNLSQELKAGDKITIILTFMNNDPITLQVEAKEP